MSNKLSEIKERIRQYVDYKGFSYRKFHMKIDASESFLKSDGGFNVDYLPSIRQKCPDLSVDWLLFDEGEMLKSDVSGVSEETAVYKVGKECKSCKSLEKELRAKEDHIETLKKTVTTITQCLDLKRSSKVS